MRIQHPCSLTQPGGALPLRPVFISEGRAYRDRARPHSDLPRPNLERDGLIRNGIRRTPCKTRRATLPATFPLLDSNEHRVALGPAETAPPETEEHVFPNVRIEFR